MAKRRGSENQVAAAGAGGAAAAREVGMLIGLLGATIMILSGLLEVLGGMGVVDVAGSPLARIVFGASALLLAALGGALRFMAKDE